MNEPENEQLGQLFEGCDEEKIGLFEKIVSLGRFWILYAGFPKELKMEVRRSEKEKKMLRKMIKKSSRENRKMGKYFGTTGMWYFDGTFYELKDTHINFFLNHSEKLGFTENEKRMLCLKNGLSADAVSCDEFLSARNNILAEVLNKGAVRIRFYRNQTSVQCGNKEDENNFLQLKKCVSAGWGNCFGSFLNVMDIHGWKELISSMNYGTNVKDFCGKEFGLQEYKYLNL